MMFALACFVSAAFAGVWIALDHNARKTGVMSRMTGK
jgi:hypothetical protein